MEFGSYPAAEDGTRKPILWNILKRKGNKALLLSVYGLDAKPYNKDWVEITWEDCTLRKWLNEDFHNAAFSEEEKKRILLTHVENDDNPGYQTPGGNDTEDKIFLLSLSEAERYLPNAFDRQVEPTPYAVEQKAYTYRGYYRGYNGNCWWWLRSPGHDASFAAVVDSFAHIDDYGSYVGGGRGAVCPALWIDLESEIE